MSATIKRGDIVRIKPEWQDPGDERFIWRALEDEDGGRVKICATNTGLTFPPNQIVNVSMLEMVQENARLLAKHTPGPWSFTVSAESGGNPSAWNIIAPCGGVVAETGSGTDDANARLIAAAPELLEALVEMLIANHGLPANENDEHDPVRACAVVQARAAIAKATGGGL